MVLKIIQDLQITDPKKMVLIWKYSLIFLRNTFNGFLIAGIQYFHHPLTTLNGWMEIEMDFQHQIISRALREIFVQSLMQNTHIVQKPNHQYWHTLHISFTEMVQLREAFNKE